MLHISLNFTLRVENRNSLEIWTVKLVSKAISTTMFKMTFRKELAGVGFSVQGSKNVIVNSNNYY